nr:GntR family transcriptional regulator [Rhodocyclus gracilis]
MRERMFEHRLRPGAALDEASLSRHYGVSRASLRAALQRLATDGLLRPAGEGFAVSALARDDLACLCEQLAQIECHLLCRLAARSSEALVAVLEDCRRAAAQGAVVGNAAEGRDGAATDEESIVAAQRWLTCLRRAAAAGGAPVFALLAAQLRRQLRLVLGPAWPAIERAAMLDLRVPFGSALLQGRDDEIERLCRMQGRALLAALEATMDVSSSGAGGRVATAAGEALPRGAHSRLGQGKVPVDSPLRR